MIAKVMTLNNLLLIHVETDERVVDLVLWSGEGRITTEHKRSGCKLSRSLRPRVARWMLDLFFSGRLDPVAHLGA